MSAQSHWYFICVAVGIEPACHTHGYKSPTFSYRRHLHVSFCFHFYVNTISSFRDVKHCSYKYSESINKQFRTLFIIENIIRMSHDLTLMAVKLNVITILQNNLGGLVSFVLSHFFVISMLCHRGVSGRYRIVILQSDRSVQYY